MRNIKLARYKKLKQRIEKAIKKGRFFHYTKKEQAQLLARLQRYYRQLIRSGQLVAPLAGLLLGSYTLTQAQSFTEITTSASPFIFNTNSGLTDIGDSASPSFVDIDGDGDFDAFIGDEDGRINYFENTGNSENPTFTPSTSTAPFGLTDVGAYASPSFVDIDGDGDFDVFIGEEYGNTNYFENTSTDSSIPAFTLISADGAFGLTTVNYNASPSFVDIDGDGDFDAFIGDDDGLINYFENTGDSANPAFTPSTSTEPFGLEAVSNYSSPRFVDIDGDGDFDAFVGEYEDHISYFENTGDSENPTFTLVSTDGAFGLDGLNYLSVPSFVDIDGDGDFDAFVGQEDGTTVYFENTSIDSSIPAFLPPFFDIGQNAAPSIIDIDSDGDLDVFVGTNEGNINYFENTVSS